MYVCVFTYTLHDSWLDVSFLYVCMYLCMYVCMYIQIHTNTVEPCQQKKNTVCNCIHTYIHTSNTHTVGPSPSLFHSNTKKSTRAATQYAMAYIHTYIHTLNTHTAGPSPSLFRSDTKKSTRPATQYAIVATAKSGTKTTAFKAKRNVMTTARHMIWNMYDSRVMTVVCVCVCVCMYVCMYV